MTDLFPETKPPRKRPQKLMHVIDAGGDCGTMINMKCPTCGYQSGWFSTEKTVTELKRGIPCPECNTEDKAMIAARPKGE